MNRIFDVDLELISEKDLLKGLNLNQAGRAQQFFSSEVIRLSDKYVPMSSGVLKNSAMLAPDKASIIYTAPYARYHWFGKLMVDPITGKGSFYDPKTGRHWSRPNTPKVLTEKDMNYQGAPLRGSRWTERMWQAEGDQITKSLEEFIERNRTI